MQFKQKLAYMALGGLLVFMGMLLLALMNHPAVAQNAKQVASFDEITCKRLNIVDDSGRIYAVLEKQDIGDSGIYNVIQILNPLGTRVCSLGGDLNGGVLSIHNRTGLSLVDIAIGDSDNEGFVKVIGKDGKSLSQLSIDKYGGVLAIINKSGQNCILASIGDMGGGIVTTRDKHGYGTGRLP